MKQFIYDSMINYLANASADRYGQLKTIDVYAVFKDKTEEVLTYLKENPIISVNTYGWTYGTYKGIGGLHDIKDAVLRSLAEETWKNNKNRITNLNQW